MCFLSDFFLWESYLIFLFFDLKALFWFTIKQQEVIFFQKDFQSLMWRRRERIRAQCGTMKKTTPMSQKLYVLQVKCPCDLLPVLYSEPLSPEARCGARSTRRPPPTGATTSSTWRAEHSRRWSRSLPATHSKATEMYSGFAPI